MRLAYLVLALSLATTALVYYRVRINVDNRAQARFERTVRDEKVTVEQRIPRYADVMLAVRGFFAARWPVSAGQWQKFINGIEIQRSYPGVRTFGYMEQVKAADAPDFTNKMRVGPGGGTELQIKPEGRRDVYYPILYVNHFGSESQKGAGYDHYADPDRRNVMDRARDTGEATATGNTHPLPGESSKGGVHEIVIYLPVYHSGLPTKTMEQRRAALQGFVFASVDTGKLFEALLGEQANPAIDCEVFSSVEMTESNLLHSADGIMRVSEKRPFQRVQAYTIPMLGRIWTIYFSSLPAFEAESGQNLPTIALIAWLTLSFLLFGLTAVEVKSRATAETMMASLRKSEAALAAEKERLAVTLYSIGDGVITTDTQGNVISINKVAEQLTGWTQAEATGRPSTSLFRLIHGTTRQAVTNPVEVVLKTGTTFNLEQAALLVARDGTERAIADSAAPILNHDGNVIGAVLVFRDVTAKQKSEAELLKESKLESVGLLAGGIAHDFNNILQGILGNLSLARMNAHSTEKMLERLTGVEKSAMRAKDLTQQLVMFARGGAPIRKQVQITGLLKDAATFALAGSNVTCEFSLGSDIWPVEVDEGQFRQVINNITLNAMQSMPDGGKIEVRAENVELTAGHLPPLAAGKYVKISIRDLGSGIRPEHLPRIFDPYFTTRKGARGLGLASAYSVVRKHEGRIHVETQVGKGTTFQIYLPISAKPAENPVRETEQKQFFGRGRVLVMDDEAEILMLAGEMLKTMGFECETARDGAEALEKYAIAKSDNNPFSLVIMDLTIPEGIGGKEAIRRLKALDPGAKAIVSSGYSYDPVMANFQEFGFCGVIPKPYVMEELGRVLAEVLGKKATAAQAAT